MKSNPPESSSHPFSCYMGLTGLLVALSLLPYIKFEFNNRLIFVLLATALPMMLLDFFYYKIYKRSGISFDKTQNTFNWKRICIKLLANSSLIFFLFFIYWLFPEYKNQFYRPFWNLLKHISPYLLAVFVPYIILVDRFSIEAEDNLYRFGLLLTGKGHRKYYHENLNYFLGWIIKGFFLPLMFVFIGGNLVYIAENPIMSSISNFKTFYSYAYNYIFTVDLAFACVGYSLSLKLFDTHLRSAEPTFLGWGVALFCYRPFWPFFSDNYLDYNNGFYWDNWLESQPSVHMIWGSIILLLIGFYTLATIFFGMRFSNLTHRGIITNGPFKLTKHPAYVSKNLSWWFVSIPFIVNESLLVSLKQCCLLILLNLVYYLRAKTEERHLSQDPVYREYARWINNHGIFNGLNKFLPFLKYRD